MSQMVNLMLRIREAAGEGGPAFLYHIQLDGEVLASNLAVSAEDARALRKLTRDYLALFEPPHMARLSSQVPRLTWPSWTGGIKYPLDGLSL